MFAYALMPRAKGVAGVVMAAAGSFLLLTWAHSPLNQLLGDWPPILAATSAGVIAGIAAVLTWFRPANHSPTALAVAGTFVVAMMVVILDALAVPAYAAVIESPFITTHTVLAFGVSLLIYAVFVLGPAASTTMPRAPTWMRTLSVVFTTLLVAAGLFAATDEYAESVGTSEAELTADLLDGRRGVIVYSKEDLGLPTSVACQDIGDATSTFRYRCEGLRLFVRTPSGVLILPATWSRFDGIDTDDNVISIRDSDSVRLEFTPGTSDLPYVSR